VAVIWQALIDTIKGMGLVTLKAKQTEAVLAVVAGKDTFVLLPTRYGKSIICGVLPPLFDKFRG